MEGKKRTLTLRYEKGIAFVSRIQLIMDNEMMGYINKGTSGAIVLDGQEHMGFVRCPVDVTYYGIGMKTNNTYVDSEFFRIPSINESRVAEFLFEVIVSTVEFKQAYIAQLKNFKNQIFDRKNAAQQLSNDTVKVIITRLRQDLFDSNLQISFKKDVD